MKIPANYSLNEDNVLGQSYNFVFPKLKINSGIVWRWLYQGRSTRLQ